MSSTLPPIQPHTLAKHHILEYHLKEWFPILGSFHRSLRYIDGFAGPGEYERGEPGSPIIALETIRSHRSFGEFLQEGKTVDFLFVEKDPKFHQHLAQKVGKVRWPTNFNVRVKAGDFELALIQLLDDAERNSNYMPPTLLFVDPFGPAGFPMDLFERLAKFDRVDILVNLNHLEFIQWILPDPIKHVTANRLYGGRRWEPALGLQGRDRAKFLVDEYENALREIGWRGTSFEMVNMQNQTAYHLIFGTGSPKGMEAIKRAMRNASQTGEFRYADRVDSTQSVLLGMDMESQYPFDVGEHVFGKYDGQEVGIDRLLEHEIDWHPWWLPSDLRKGLSLLEYGDDPRILEVRNHDGRMRRRDSYPPGCRITFGRPPQRRLL